MPSVHWRSLAVVALLGSMLSAGGCAPATPARTRFDWHLAGVEPAFDPSAPARPARDALERLLTRGLTDEDSSGAIVPAAAASWEWSEDSLALTFRLQPGLSWADGTPCRAADVRAAIERGLADRRHATKAWRLRAVKGVAAIRAGRPLPPLGLETPDDRTLVLRLARPDRTLPLELSKPGMSDPWRAADSTWHTALGLGPYRVIEHVPGRWLRLARGEGTLRANGPDTVFVRLAPGVGRTLSLLRQGLGHRVWPAPWAIGSGTTPAGTAVRTRDTRPPRRLLLVQRADVPPTSRIGTRQAIAHALRVDELVRALGTGARRAGAWIGPGPDYLLPPPDARAVREAMARANLGRSFPVRLVFDPDGPGAAVAGSIQDQLATFAIYVELDPQRGANAERHLLSGQSQLALVETAAPADGAAGELASIVTPGRGPAVGAIRTGWRTREFDRWLDGRAEPSALDAEAIVRRIEEERIVLPLAELPWRWIERDGAPPARFHPRYGPECAAFTVGEPSRP